MKPTATENLPVPQKNPSPVNMEVEYGKPYRTTALGLVSENNRSIAIKLQFSFYWNVIQVRRLLSDCLLCSFVDSSVISQFNSLNFHQHLLQSPRTKTFLTDGCACFRMLPCWTLINRKCKKAYKIESTNNNLDYVESCPSLRADCNHWTSWKIHPLSTTVTSRSVSTSGNRKRGTKIMVKLILFALANRQITMA